MTAKKTKTVDAAAETPDVPETPDVSYATKYVRVLLKCADRRGWKPADLYPLDKVIIEALYDELFPAPQSVTLAGNVTFGYDWSTRASGGMSTWTWFPYSVTAPARYNGTVTLSGVLGAH